MKTDPILCNFSAVRLEVPRGKLIKLLVKKRYLQHEEVIFLKVLYAQAELKENQILHIKSIIEKALLKSK